MSPEEAVKKLIAEIRDDRRKSKENQAEFCAEIRKALAEYKAESAKTRDELRTEHAKTRDEIIGLKLVLSDTRAELAAARADITQQKADLRMVADYTGMTENKKAGNGHGRKR